METISCCPICNIQVLTVELEWHANSHFDDDQLQRDMELAHQMAIAESSTNTMGPHRIIVDTRAITVSYWRNKSLAWSEHKFKAKFKKSKAVL